MGSRGQPLLGKRELLAVLLDAIAPASVIDVGCGDGEATRGLPMPGYVGIDLSSEALRLAEIGRPEGTFLSAGWPTSPSAPISRSVSTC